MKQISSFIPNRSTLIFLILLCVNLVMPLSQVYAQEQGFQFLLPGPQKTIILTGELFQDQQASFLKTGESLLVYRSDNGETEDFKLLGELSFPSSARILKERLDRIAATEDVLQQLKVRNINQAFRLLNTVTPDTLGMLLLSAELGEALGLMYIDYERDPMQPSVYRIEKTDASKQLVHSITLSINAGLPDIQEHFQPKTYLPSDSSVIVSWSSPLYNRENDLPLFLNIYRKTGHQGTFLFHRKLMVLTPDSIAENIVSFRDETLPGQHLAYYVQPEDYAGNKGLLSDTLYMLSIDVSAVQNITNVQVTDTLNGLLLTWDALPWAAYYTAIEITKTRELATDYVVLDTISADRTEYLDRQVIPSTSYYYKVRPLVAHIAGMEEMLPVEAMGHKSGEKMPRPAAPRRVSASLLEEGVRIHWIHGDEPNLFAYYVFRGTHPDRMVQISEAVMDTVFLDNLNIKGYTGQLHYAVRVMDQAQQMSDTSDVASVFIQQPAILSTPTGIQARRTTEGTVLLQWEDARIRDEQIHGFTLYRRNKGTEEFEPIHPSILQVSIYTDSTALDSESYEYAVSSTDFWGNHSSLSPHTSTARDLSARLHPPTELYVRNLRAGIELSWPALLIEDPTITYLIYRNKRTEPAFLQIGQCAPGEVFIDEDVLEGESYQYAVSVQINLGKQTEEGEKGMPSMPIRRR